MNSDELLYFLLLQLTTNDGVTTTSTSDEKLSEKQLSLQKGLQQHLKEMYPSEDSAAAVFSKDGSLYLNISAEKVNLRNFWSGRMHSNWVVLVNPPKTDDSDVVAESKVVTISGDIKVSSE